MYSYLKSQIFFGGSSLTNGERIRLAAYLLDGCTPAPRTRLGKLFDDVVKGLHYLINCYDAWDKSSPFKDFSGRGFATPKNGRSVCKLPQRERARTQPKL